LAFFLGLRMAGLAIVVLSFCRAVPADEPWSPRDGVVL
jgi:hypothetical protein